MDWPSLTALAFATDARRHDYALRFRQGFVHVVYPDFETDPHPVLRRSVKPSLHNREIDCVDYNGSTNPPVLHRKETFLASDHPLHARFARLTPQEEKHGLLDDSSVSEAPGRPGQSAGRAEIRSERTQACEAMMEREQKLAESPPLIEWPAQRSRWTDSCLFRYSASGVTMLYTGPGSQ